MKILADILSQVQTFEIIGSTHCEVTSLACDSRRVEAGSVFFALPGLAVDGFDFVPQAIERGASVVVAERGSAMLEDVVFIQVANVRQVMAQMAAAFYDHPTRDIPVVGITGTNGKTTTSYLLESVLRQAGFCPALFGTISYRCGEIVRESSHTTPESIDLLQMMREFRDQGADAFVMEVSSHALEQYRVDGIEFDFAIFTNLTPEHLDYHQTLDNYFNSKKRLFCDLLGDGMAVVNKEDTYGQQLLGLNSKWIAFGHEDADVMPHSLESDRYGIRGKVKGPQGEVCISSPMIGDFNVSNLLAAIATVQQLGISAKDISVGISQIQVPGRLERVANDRDILVLVDYAHTSDALEQVLKTLAKIAADRRYTLVGCGGDRDNSKRPVMASTSTDYSDLSIFTSDNPRTEDPLLILEQIRQGALAAGAKEVNEQQACAGEKGFIVIPDRREAIRFACQLAQPGDIALIAGKGHEDYQILGTEKIHFDDREEVSLALSCDQISGGRDV